MMTIIMYLDENEFNKKMGALKRYFRKTYKYMVFTLFPRLKMDGKRDGKYTIELPTDELFKRVYGPFTLYFTVSNDIAMLENITPEPLLKACFEKTLPIYKGIPYNTKKDLIKIKIAEKLI